MAERSRLDGGRAPRAAPAVRAVPGHPSSRPIMRQVAERAGVALSSVSRVLSGHPDVSPVMRNRVLDAVSALGYQRDLLAQSLRTGQTMTVGFLVADISNPFLSQVALGAEVRLREAGYALLLANSFNDISQDVAHVRLLQQRRVDGLLLSLSDEVDPGLVDLLHRLEVPAVLVDRQIAGWAGGAVVTDHTTGIERAVAHLAGLGHRSIGLVNDSRKVRPSLERAAALRRACRAIPGMRGVVRTASLRPGAAVPVAQEFLGRTSAPTAVIAGSNQILTGVLAALRALGKSAPADFSLVTCDDFPFSDHLGITTITRDSMEIGRTAGTLLLEQVRGEPPRTVVLPTGFRVTDSCGPPRS